MISSTSSLASSMPATSAKVTLFWLSLTRRARLLPKLIALPPPDWIWRMKNTNIASTSTIGSHVSSTLVRSPELSSFSL